MKNNLIKKLLNKKMTTQRFKNTPYVKMQTLQEKPQHIQYVERIMQKEGVQFYEKNVAP